MKLERHPIRSDCGYETLGRKCAASRNFRDLLAKRRASCSQRLTPRPRPRPGWLRVAKRRRHWKRLRKWAIAPKRLSGPNPRSALDERWARSDQGSVRFNDCCQIETKQECISVPFRSVQICSFRFGSVFGSVRSGSGRIGRRRAGTRQVSLLVSTD